jgi:hypothetical protein
MSLWRETIDRHHWILVVGKRWFHYYGRKSPTRYAIPPFGRFHLIRVDHGDLPGEDGFDEFRRVA